VNLIGRAAQLFDHIVVAVSHNRRKSTALFSVDERLDMLRTICAAIPGVEVDAFEGLLIDYMRARGARIVLRGLRAISDFEYEFQMAHINQKLHGDVETVFLMTGPEEFFISSNVVKEVASLGGPVDVLVPASVRRELERKFRKAP
jgi:pantetheine-phosphate adenylyltransferase